MSLLLKALKKKQGIRRYIGPKRIALLLLLVGCVWWAWSAYRAGLLDPAFIERYRDNHPVVAVVIFVIAYALFVVAALPSLPLNLAGGFYWGGLLGGVYSTIGVTLGGWVSFAVARWLIGQPLAEKFDNKWVDIVQREFNRGGWKFVAFARINPVIPTGPLNYLLGLTSISTKVFLGATFLFLLPPAIGVAYIGDTLQTFVAQQSGVNEIVRGILVTSAVVTGLFAVKFISRIFRIKADE